MFLIMLCLIEEITLLSSKSYQSQEIYRNLYEQYQQQLYAPVQQRNFNNNNNKN